MANPSLLSQKDRNARSRLQKLLHQGKPVARAGLVTMARLCGKKGCKCAEGHKHVSLYLSTRLADQRKMLFVPPQLEDAAREMVGNYKAVEALVDEMSQASLESLIARKARRKQAKP